MAQLFFHDKKDTNFKKSMPLKHKKQKNQLIILYILLGMSLILNILQHFYKF